MPIAALPTPPSRSDPTNFAARGDAFLAALPTFVDEANALAIALNLNSTTDASASSVVIGTGAKTFAVTAGKSFQPGMYLVIADTAAPSTNSMWGQVTSYSGTALVMSIIAVRGSGTKTAWVISQSAAGNAAAGANADITSLSALTTALSIAQGGTGAVTANAAADALGAYRKGTLRGTVSQSAGVPTGAVIERGSNANGEYVRFADGTQICTGISPSLTANGSFGAVFGSGSATATYAASFAAVPKVCASCDSVSGWVISLANTNTSVNFYGVSPVSGTTLIPQYIAVGRWF